MTDEKATRETGNDNDNGTKNVRYFDPKFEPDYYDRHASRRYNQAMPLQGRGNVRETGKISAVVSSLDEYDNRKLIEDVFKAFQNALVTFYKRDIDLFRLEFNKSVSERCMVFRIAYYMLEELDEDLCYYRLNLDCEYNRFFDHIKELQIDVFPKKRPVIPDLIIHKRQNGTKNILVIEFKKKGARNIDIERDKKRVVAFTRENGEFRYKYGLTVVLSKKETIVKIFKNGKQIKILKYVVRKQSNIWMLKKCLENTDTWTEFSTFVVPSDLLL